MSEKIFSEKNMKMFLNTSTSQKILIPIATDDTAAQSTAAAAVSFAIIARAECSVEYKSTVDSIAVFTHSKAITNPIAPYIIAFSQPVNS